MNLKAFSEQIEIVYDGLDDVYEHLPPAQRDAALLLLSQLDGLRDMLLEVRDDGEEEEVVDEV